MRHKEKILIILGPTSAGKTDLALQLARKFVGELISADSRQVYKGLDIGTGKIAGSGQFKKARKFWEIDGVKVWMLDEVDPVKQYSVFDYVTEAKKVLDDIFARKKLPIIVGGTGLYVKGLMGELPNLEIPIDQKLREQLNSLTTEQLQQKLQKLASERWEGMNYSDRQNPRRLIRAIELAMAKTESQITDNESQIKDYDVLKIGLTAPREILYKRSDKRVIVRIKQGMIEEAAKLHKEGLTLNRMRQLGLEYGVLADYLIGSIDTKNKLVKILQEKIHGYIRRQITWFKKEKNINWFDISSHSYPNIVEKLVARWYYQSYVPKN